jgi:putative cardiolipin synthase
LNLDSRALLHNSEIGIVVKVPEIAEEMAKWFEENVEQLAFRLELKKDKNGGEKLLWQGVVDGKELTFDVDPYTGF